MPHKLRWLQTDAKTALKGGRLEGVSKDISYTFLDYGCIRAQCTSAAEAEGFISFTAGLKTCSTPLWDTFALKML